MTLLAQTGLIACYVALAVLLLTLNLYSHWPWRVKVLAIFLVAGFYLVSYFSIPPLLGWPTDAVVPERFKLAAVFVNEPDKAKGTEGAIYLWVTDVREGPDGPKPRSHRLPYSTQLHEKVNEAGNKLRKGIPQVGEIADGGFDRIKPEDAFFGGDVSADVEFFDLPPPQLPDK
jgi:hypothetical protein